MYWNCSVPTSHQILNPKTILLHTLNRVQRCGSVPLSWQISRSLPPSSNCSPAPRGAVELPPCELTRLDKLTELLSLWGKFVKVGIIHRNCHWYFDPVVEPVEKYKIVTECYKLLTLHYIVFWLLPPLYYTLLRLLRLLTLLVLLPLLTLLSLLSLLYHCVHSDI